MLDAVCHCGLFTAKADTRCNAKCGARCCARMRCAVMDTALRGAIRNRKICKIKKPYILYFVILMYCLSEEY